jgi:DNA polymerase-4
VDADRAVLHVDMDAFFASVEVLDRPELAGRPVIVGGSGARGVVASCTYEARAFGVRSAMPSLRARQLCPGAVFVHGRYDRYAEVSAELLGILSSFTPLVEPIGLDEAFLDVTGVRRSRGTAEQVAWEARSVVRARLSLDCSIGVARSKLLAKLASRAAKPTATLAGARPGRGVVLVAPDRELAFLHPHPVEALWGVGPATARRLHGLGVRTVGQLAALPEAVLVRLLGRSHGVHLAALARGLDPSPVVPERPAKSIGHEQTFARDVHDVADLRRQAGSIAAVVAAQLRRNGLAGRTVTLKVRFADFSTVTRSHTLPVALDTGPALAAIAVELVGTAAPNLGVRLMGLSVSGLQREPLSRQLAFDLGAGSGAEPSIVGSAIRLQDSWRDVTAAVDAVRERFGRQALGTADQLGERGVHVPDRRESPWGPADPSASEPP